MAFDANDLSPHEHFVVERTRAGEIADFSALIGADGVKPPVRAGFVRKLMLRLDPSWQVQLPGVRIKGARIEGALDLTDCSGAGGAGLPALSLEHCDIPDPIDVSHARLARLSVGASRLRRLYGHNVSIDGEFDFSAASALADSAGAETLYIRMMSARIGGAVWGQQAKLARNLDGAEFNGETDYVLSLQGAAIGGNLMLRELDVLGCVWLQGAQIGGTVFLSGAQLLNRRDDASGRALMLEGTTVAGPVLLRGGFKAEGEVRLNGASIAGGLDLTGGAFRNEGGAALMLADMEIRGAVVGAVKAAGHVSFQSASIERDLDLSGAEIADPLTARGDTFGRALDLTCVKVGGAALFHGANIKGELYMPDARIGGYLAFGAGRFIHPGGWAIRAPNVRVGGNLTFKLPESGFTPHGQKTVIEGGAKFDRAQIDGAVAWNALELRGPSADGLKGGRLSFADARIAGALQAQALTLHAGAVVDVSGASCAALDDNLRSGWGGDGVTLDLEGFAYERIESDDDTWRQRVAWLKRTRAERRFSPLPFAQLARVYARSGRREDARRAQLAAQDARTRAGAAGPFTWLLSSGFGLVAGYGLAPIRAARALLLYLALGVAGVLAMNAQGALVTPQGQACNGAIEPALYAIDVALPVIDLGQETRCGPGRAPRAELAAGVAVGEFDWRLFEGLALWKWAHALYAVLGALLTALAVITFSGMLKPRDE